MTSAKPARCRPLSPKQAAFLAAFRECGTLDGAFHTTGTTIGQHRRWLLASSQYAETYRQIREETAHLRQAPSELGINDESDDGHRQRIWAGAMLLRHCAGFSESQVAALFGLSPFEVSKTLVDGMDADLSLLWEVPLAVAFPMLRAQVQLQEVREAA